MTTSEEVVLGSYKLVEKLGHGGMGEVYRAEREGEAGFRKTVAVKRILQTYRHDPLLLERFGAEARTNARLSHPNLVQVLDFDLEPEPYLVLEYVEGVSVLSLLDRLAQRGRRIGIAAATFVAAEAAQGLDHAHRMRDEDGNPLGIVHRDVSPQNMLLSKDGAVKVGDFGVAKAADNIADAMARYPVGKYDYMPPEQAQGHAIDARGDVFALGVVLWEMLTMRRLLPLDPRHAWDALQHCQFPPPSVWNPEVPRRLEGIVMACLSGSPDDRPPSAQAVASQLRDVLHETSPGYGAPELSRLVRWAFPEREWPLEHPFEPPDSPPPPTRDSVPRATPVAVAVKRAEWERKKAWLTEPRTVALVLLGALMALGVVGMAAALGLRLADRIVGADEVAADTAMPAIRIVADAPGASVWLGPTELGPAPQRISADALTGRPVVVLAPGHQPAVVRPEQLSELASRPDALHRVEPVSSEHPDVVVYVGGETAGAAKLVPGGDALGHVPGVLRVPAEAVDQGAHVELVDRTGRAIGRIELAACVPGRVCAP